MAHFRPIKAGKTNTLNNRQEKLKCNTTQTNLVSNLLLKSPIFFAVAFKMYDLDDDESISRDELLNILHMMVGANISQDQLISIAERTIMEADQCGQGKISFDDFCKALDRCDVERKMSIRFLN